MKIAFFDSGVGGLTVLHEALRVLPQEDYIYMADTLNVPYGTKPKEIVRQSILQAVDTLVTAETMALVIACNTATSIAIKELREHYKIPVIGMEPAVKPAVEMNKQSRRRVLVLATPLTLKETKYHNLVNRIDDLSIVDSLPLPELVGFCEALDFDGPAVKAYMEEQLSGYHWEDYGTVVLGCTHFPFYRRLLSDYLPAHIQLIDGSGGTVKHLKELLTVTYGYSSYGKAGEKTEGTGLHTEPHIEFLVTGHDRNYEKKLQDAFGWYKEDRR